VSVSSQVNYCSYRKATVLVISGLQVAVAIPGRASVEQAPLIKIRGRCLAVALSVL